GGQEDLVHARGAAFLFDEFGQKSRQQFKPFCVVAGGLGERDAIVRIVGQYHAVVVGLHLAVASADFSARFFLDFRQQFFVFIIGRDRKIELMVAVFGTHTG